MKITRFYFFNFRLGLNNELYRSHVELKRQIVELCVQAVLADLRGNEQGKLAIKSSKEQNVYTDYYTTELNVFIFVLLFIIFHLQVLQITQLLQSM